MAQPPCGKQYAASSKSIELTYDPLIPSLGIPQIIESRTQTGIYTPMFTAALLRIAKRYKQLNFPTDE